MSTGINFNSAFHRNCGDVSHRYGLLVDFDLYLFSNSKKNNINRIKAGTEMACNAIETGKNMTGYRCRDDRNIPHPYQTERIPRHTPYTELGTHPVFDEKNVWFYDTFDNRKASKYFDLVYQSNEILDLIESRLESFRKSFPPFQKQRTDTPLQYGTL